MDEALILIKGLLGIRLEFAKAAIQLLMLQGLSGVEITPEKISGMMTALQSAVVPTPGPAPSAPPTKP